LLSVAVVDDHPATRLGIIAALNKVSGIHVVGEAGTGPELEALLEGTVPDVLLLDISMPDFDVFQAVPWIQDKYPKMRIVIVTIHEDEKHVYRLAELGVDGYLLKEEPVAEYVKAIEAVIRGGTYFSQRILPIAWGFSSRPSVPNLTPRELEVLELLSTGAKMDVIAQELFITPRTVTTHVSHIYSKLGVNNRTAAMRKAIELGLVSV